MFMVNNTTNEKAAEEKALQKNPSTPFGGEGNVPFFTKTDWIITL